MKKFHFFYLDERVQSLVIKLFLDTDGKFIKYSDVTYKQVFGAQGFSAFFKYIFLKI